MYNQSVQLGSAQAEQLWSEIDAKYKELLQFIDAHPIEGRDYRALKIDLHNYCDTNESYYPNKVKKLFYGTAFDTGMFSLDQLVKDYIEWYDKAAKVYRHHFFIGDYIPLPERAIPMRQANAWQGELLKIKEPGTMLLLHLAMYTALGAIVLGGAWFLLKK